MGHHTDNMIDPYIGHTVTLDIQSSYLDMPLQKDLVKRVVGIAAHRDLRALSAPRSSLLLSRTTKRRNRLKATSEFRKEFFEFFENETKVVVYPDAFTQQGSSSLNIGVRPEPSSLLRVVLRLLSHSIFGLEKTQENQLEAQGEYHQKSQNVLTVS